jgi:hypothetical protein
MLSNLPAKASVSILFSYTTALICLISLAVFLFTKQTYVYHYDALGVAMVMIPIGGFFGMWVTWDFVGTNDPLESRVFNHVYISLGLIFITTLLLGILADFQAQRNYNQALFKLELAIER